MMEAVQVHQPSMTAADARQRNSDPLAAVLALGNRASKIGAFIGLFLALTTHGAVSGKAIASSMLRDMRVIVTQMHDQAHHFLWATYDVDLDKEKPQQPKPPEPEKAPEPEPEPEPAPKAVAPPPPKDDPYEPPPAAAAAQKILTREPDPNEIVDMTDQGIASGDGSGPGYGMVAGAGTAKETTYNPNAKVDGVVGGKGTGEPRPPPPPPPPPTPDRSQSAKPIRSDWGKSCPFPPEADVEQVDVARVMIMVTVRADGTAQAVKIVSDPGYGFGRAARICALSQRYNPALDRTGRPTTGTTPPFAVKFTR